MTNRSVPGLLGHDPRRPAVVMADSGVVVTYGELEQRSNQLANLLRARGLDVGDHLAVLLENQARYLEVHWAAMKAGLYLTPINWHLRAEEAGYIVEDCGASAIITSTALAATAIELEPHLSSVGVRLVVDDELPGFERYEPAVASQDRDLTFDPAVEGTFMFYSSGTTGRPKGIKPPLPTLPYGESPALLGMLMQAKWGFGADTVYLCPAPLYHAAPIGWSTTVQRLGGTVVVMERFDPERALELIAKHRVTHLQMVPTHFIRMLKLTDAQRGAHDLSSLRMAVHAAAPCPSEVKDRMIEWWGPIVHEYYAGSEGNGFTAIDSEEWLAHRGSVGTALIGTIHILDEAGNEVPPGTTGQIWFESATRFEYHNDPAKTAAAFNRQGWSSLGDVGHVDADGYLYLTDRVSHMIISGGVNIYPQEIEDLLALHPAVDDVAVIGIPEPDMGEQVWAVVKPTDPGAGESVAEELLEHCRARLSSFKCPRGVDFVDELPRLPTGKLLKRDLRARYWADGAS